MCAIDQERTLTKLDMRGKTRLAGTGPLHGRIRALRALAWNATLLGEENQTAKSFA